MLALSWPRCAASWPLLAAAADSVSAAASAPVRRGLLGTPEPARAAAAAACSAVLSAAREPVAAGASRMRSEVTVVLSDCARLRLVTCAEGMGGDVGAAGPS